MLFGIDKQNVDLLTTKFQQFGLRKYQSAALSVICVKGACTALEVSDHSGVPMTKTYQVLYSLRDHDLISVNMERPKKFSADLQRVVDVLIDRQRRSFNRFKRQAEKVPQLLVAQPINML